jgi:LL-diaminopimelate aminotransferase
MKNIATQLQQVDEYVFSYLAKKVKEVEARTNSKVINLGMGSPNIEPKEEYKKFLSDEILEPKNFVYPGYTATTELKQAIVNFHKWRYGYELETNKVTIANGSKDAVVHLMQVILDPGDEILIPNPGYPAYHGYAKIIGAIPVSYRLSEENNFLPKIDELEKLVSEKTKAIWVNYPGNPTGAVINRPLLEEIVKWAKERGIWILYDNAYSEIYFGEEKPISIFEIEGAIECAVELFSFSKGYSLAGYRIGWTIGNSKIVDALEKLKSLVDSGMFLPLQKLAVEVLNDRDLAWQENMRTEYKQSQLAIAELLKEIDLRFELPEASLYIWAKIPDEFESSMEYVMQVLENKHILVTPGSAFGEYGDRYVRASICSKIK